VTLKAIPNYQTKSSYSINVIASDGTLSSTKAVTVAVTDVAPTITSSASVTVVEGTPITTPVFTATATDVVGSTVTYSLSGTDAAQFNINAATGVVTLKAIPNYQTKSSYSINVIASDGTLSSTKAVTVSVTIPSVQILSPKLTGTNFFFQFPTVNGQSYTIQQNVDLTTTNWVFCTNIVGNGSTQQFQWPVSATPAQHFFRIFEP
jgi:Cadherin domain